jgi:hypothetical protein
MAPQSATYCFSCARPVTEPHQIHRLEDGSACQGCVERTLEGLPALLPRVLAADAESYADLDIGAQEGGGPGFPQGGSGGTGFDLPPDCA